LGAAIPRHWRQVNFLRDGPGAGRAGISAEAHDRGNAAGFPTDQALGVLRGNDEGQQMFELTGRYVSPVSAVRKEECQINVKTKKLGG